MAKLGEANNNTNIEFDTSELGEINNNIDV